MDQIINTKQCNKCKTVKLKTEFPKSTKTKDNFSLYCKDCESERLKIYYKANKAKIEEKHDEYYRNNKDKIQEKKQLWNQENKEKMTEYFHKYRKEWAKRNPEKLKEYKKKAYMKKLYIMLNQPDEGEIKK